MITLAHLRELQGRGQISDRVIIEDDNGRLCSVPLATTERKAFYGPVYVLWCVGCGVIMEVTQIGAHHVFYRSVDPRAVAKRFAGYDVADPIVGLCAVCCHRRCHMCGIGCSPTVWQPRRATTLAARGRCEKCYRPSITEVPILTPKLGFVAARSVVKQLLGATQA